MKPILHVRVPSMTRIAELRSSLEQSKVHDDYHILFTTGDISMQVVTMNESTFKDRTEFYKSILIKTEQSDSVSPIGDK